jgi:cation:H+ antiporter
MLPIMSLLILIIGFFLLIKGSDLFVTYASRIAVKLGVSEFVIGLTVVAVGTSLPELGSSVAAALSGHSEIVIGNVIGSNITNICLIIGISAFLIPLAVKKEFIHEDGIIMIVVSTMLLIAGLNGAINQTEGLIFLLIYVIYILYLFHARDDAVKVGLIRYILSLFYNKQEKITSYKDPVDVGRASDVVKDLILMALFLGGILLGAKFAVDSALNLGVLIGMDDKLIGFTIIALGTSLPELSVSVVAALRKHGDISIGNIVGSNITNILLVLSISSTITPIITNSEIFMLGYMVLCSILFIATLYLANHNLRRQHGLFLISLYLIFLAILFIGI